jgi:hypothetical protein
MSDLRIAKRRPSSVGVDFHEGRGRDDRTNHRIHSQSTMPTRQLALRKQR